MDLSDVVKKRKPKAKRRPRGKAGRAARAVFVETQPQLAFLFGVSSQGVKKWLDNGAPSKTGDGYDLRKWIAWWAQRKVGGAQGSSSTRADAETRLKVARARQEEHAADLLDKRYIERSEAQKGRNELLDWFVSVFETQPAALGSRLVGKKLAEIMRIIRANNDAVRTAAAKRRK